MSKKRIQPSTKSSILSKPPSLPSVNVGNLLVIGLSLHKQGHFVQAKEYYEQVLKVQPNHCDALQLLGSIYIQEASAEKALTLISQALRINPGFAEAYSNYGLALQMLNRFDEALDSFDRSIQLNPNYAEAHLNKGELLRLMGNLEDALTNLDHVISISPESITANINRGLVLHQLNRPEEALANLDKAINLDPLSDKAYSYRGNVLLKLNRLEEAINSFDKAIQLNPFSAEIYSNRGVLLNHMKNYHESLACQDKAISLDPNFAEAYCNRGNVLIELGLYDKALEDFERAVSINVDYADALLNMALLFLQKEDYTRGWHFFESRFKKKNQIEKFKFFNHVCNLPMWNGISSTERLLVWGEQGLGDQILFGSLLPELKGFAQTKLVALEERLLSLFSRSMPELQFVDIKKLKVDAGYGEQIAIGSLPKLFRPNKNSFAKVTSPYLIADVARVHYLRKLVQRPGKLVVGVSWSSKRMENDIGERKSASLAQMLISLASEALHFVNLQYGDTLEERTALQRAIGIEVQSVEQVDNFNDIDGLAALIEACDVVLTTSNTTVHLAGALGKDTLLLLPHGGARLWYWAHEQSSSLWYPSVKIYTQEIDGVWQHPLAAIKHYLENKLCK